MKELTKNVLVIVIMLGVFGCAMGACAQAVQYQIVDLGISYASAYAVNNNGQVVGTFSTPNGEHAFLWQNGAATNLGPVSGGGTYAYGINDKGQVIGASSIVGAFVWQDGTMTPLGLLPAQSVPYAINNIGQVVGVCPRPTQSSAACQAALWQNSVTTTLKTLPGGLYSGAHGINDSGQVVGSATTPGGSWHAVLWAGDTVTDLDTLGGSSSEATAINASGQVVGSSTKPDGSEHAFLWQHGGMTDLGTLAGSISSQGTGINDSGQIVGDCEESNGYQYQAFLWQNGVMTALDAPAGSTTTHATAINNNGWIVGTAYESDGNHAILWKPVPEPSSMLALAFGILPLAGAAVKRTRSA